VRDDEKALRFRSKEAAEAALVKVRAVEHDPDIQWQVWPNGHGRFLVVGFGPDGYLCDSL
jgi:hypothetical protein